MVGVSLSPRLFWPERQNDCDRKLLAECGGVAGLLRFLRGLGVAYIELRDCADILSPLPEQIYASMFVNEEKYLVVSNMTDIPYALCLRDAWIDRESSATGSTFTVAPKRILFLRLIQTEG